MATGIQALAIVAQGCVARSDDRKPASSGLDTEPRINEY